MTVAFKGQNMRCNPVKEPTVVADDHNASRKFQQTLFEGSQAILNGLLNRTGADRQGSARDEPLTPTPWEGLQP